MIRYQTSCILLLLSCILSGAMVQAQKPDWMKPHPESKSLFVQGLLRDREDSTKVIKGQITVINVDNANESYSFTPNGTGIFQFHLWENSTYVVDFSAPGYISRKITFDTYNVPNKDWRRGCNVEVTMSLDMRPDGFKDFVTVKPFVNFKFSQEAHMFLFDGAELDLLMEKYFEELERARPKNENKAGDPIEDQ